ncbi:MAG: hypothetical protein KatS3mg040_1818 [Candidatus Kapaibacterium sp.]|nr:MAG: hypothetical protein KatS3mg040_1818 [Candidatus Kapabacteria bacterium]
MAWHRVVLLLTCGVVLGAQQPQWHELLRDPNARYDEIERAFERQRKERLSVEEDEREEGEEDGVHFGRWADFWQLRLMPDGSFPSGEILWQELSAKIAQQRQRKQQKGARQQSSANFTHLGPISIPTNGGAGRINCIAFHPTNSNIVFVGAPSGGLWKSTDGGSSWSSSTDTLATLGVSAITIDPSNPQVIYIGTGDRDARDTYGVGILKSTDGGATWNATGLNWTTPQNRVVCDIVIFPGSTSTLLAATSNGIWRSTDGGQTWSQRTTSYTMELRLHPTNPAIVFASTYSQSGGAAILRSLDGGVSWSSVWSSTSVNRIALALAPTAPRRVYALCSSSSNSGFYGLYMSLDTGSTWSQQSATPNILGSNTSGTSTGGQGWYDLCLAVHPQDSLMLFAGGINVWRSDNAGQGWTIVSYWSSSQTIPYVHADQHTMLFRPGTTELWVGNDGGVFRTTNAGSSWQDLSSGLAILQVYRMSHHRGSSTPVILAGTQDNGTNRRTSSGSWAQVYGGDGMENAIDWVTPSTMYCSIYYGSFYRSTNSGSSWSAIAPSNESGNGAWVTPFVMHPSNPQLLYVAYRTVYRSTNRGSNWTSLGAPLATNARARYLAVAPSNTDVIVVGTSSTMFRTTDGGTNWTSIAGGLPASVSNVAIDPSNPAVLWATCSNWASGQKVFRSTDGGSTWTNLSSGLPNVPVNCIALDPRNGNAYVGTDIGVYLRTPAAAQWTMWDDGLPNVIVRDLELDTATNRIYAATYGRGIWQGTLLNQTLTAAIWASRTTLCAGDTVRLADASSGQVATRQWTISGGSPATATDSALTVTFPNPGQFTVRLVVASGTLVDSTQVTVTVNPRPSVTVSLSAQHVCEGDSIVATASGNGIARYQWNTGDTTQRIILRAVGTYSLQVLVTSGAGCSTASAVVQCSILARPPVPSVSITGRNPFCEGDSVVLQAPSGYATYQWSTGATSQQITVRSGGNYLVTVTDANGCWRLSDTIRLVRWPKPPLTMQVFGTLSFCEGDSVVLLATSSPGAAFFWLDGSSAQGNRRVIRTSGTYAVLVIDTNGCRIQSDPFVVAVFPKPIPRLTVQGSTTLCGNETTTLDAGEEFAQYRWNTGQTTRTITVSQPGQYWCTCTTARGCSNTSDTVRIRRDSVVRPSVTSSTGRFEACAGDTIELDAGPGYTTYAWNTGDSTRRIAVTEPGEYVVSVVTAAGCSGSSLPVRVRFFDPPPTPEIIREGNRLRCSVDGVQYQWYRDGVPIAGATDQALEITESGQYGVRITDANGCSAESREYNAIVSVTDEPAGAWVTLEPNPAEDEVLVRIESTLPSSIELYDLYGRLVLQSWTFDGSSSRTQVRLDLQGIARGTYVVFVRSGHSLARLRLVRW